MSLRRIRIGERDIAQNHVEFAAALARAHADRIQPVCLCRSDGVPMYVARYGDDVFLKLLPDSGPDHAADCDSYEPPEALSGRAAKRAAIAEDANTGLTRLKLDFSLVRVGSRGRSEGATERDGTEAVPRPKGLSLRALLHLLWDEAEFTRWRPAMQGKRNWAVIRKYLLEASERLTAKRRPLSELLFVPEIFTVAAEPAIETRRAAAFAKSLPDQKGRRALRLLIGEVKDVASARGAHRIVVKHLPKMPLLIDDAAAQSMTRRYADAFALWRATPSAHLVALATAGVAASGVASIDEIALMLVDERWVPIESAYEGALVDALARSGSSFRKCLRYDAAPKASLASAVMLRPGEEPVAMFLMDRSEEGDATRDELVADVGMSVWIWHVAGEAMPPFPL